MTAETLTREIKFFPGYDKLSEGYGVGSVRLFFVLKGPKGALTFSLFTDFYPKSALERWEKEKRSKPYTPYYLGFLDYHSPTPTCDYQSSIESCPFLDGKRCYCDGTSLVDDLTELFITQGTDKLWAELEHRYKEYFQ